MNGRCLWPYYEIIIQFTLANIESRQDLLSINKWNRRKRINEIYVVLILSPPIPQHHDDLWFTMALLTLGETEKDEYHKKRSSTHHWKCSVQFFGSIECFIPCEMNRNQLYEHAYGTCQAICNI